MLRIKFELHSSKIDVSLLIYLVGLHSTGEFCEYLEVGLHSTGEFCEYLEVGLIIGCLHVLEHERVVFHPGAIVEVVAYEVNDGGVVVKVINSSPVVHLQIQTYKYKQEHHRCKASRRGQIVEHQNTFIAGCLGYMCY